jgi:hypothetical protein
VSTKPPTCWLRWRGKPISCAAAPATGARAGRRGPGRPAHALGARQRCRRTSAAPWPGVDRAPGRCPARGPRRAGAARAVADDHGGERGAVAAVLGVDVLDDLFAALVLEVDVDVGRLVALAADEALEQHAHARRVHLGHAQAVADRRIGRRAAALAQDAAAARKAHHVVHGEEVHLVAQLGDQRQLVLDLLLHGGGTPCG